jgi:hypothetical protein
VATVLVVWLSAIYSSLAIVSLRTAGERTMKAPLPFPPQTPTLIGKTYLRQIEEVVRHLGAHRIEGQSERMLAEQLTSQDVDEIWQSTEDPLSHYFKDDRRDLSDFKDRVDSESIVAAILNKNTSTLSLDTIETFGGMCVDLPIQKIRTTRLVTLPNSRGKSVEFALPEDVPVILGNVCKVWRDGIPGESDVYAALWIMVGVLNAHPFTDGNGRLARALANGYLIKRGLLKCGPLPLGALCYAAAANYVVAIRRVVLDGNWEQLARVMLGMLRAYQKFVLRTSMKMQRLENAISPSQ